MLNRRDFLKSSGAAFASLQAGPAWSALTTMNVLGRDRAVRCINVVNFIRGVEPRFETDLLLPVRRQMEIILAHDLPATWLLQYDALVDSTFTGFLKSHMAASHEVGFWFEMNQKHCNDAGVEWRGRPGFEWDHFPPVAFTIGYSPAERVLLADAAMKKFKEIWGEHPKSVASWNLDSLTISHLVDRYGVDAFAVCRDQIATDGFTIWGAPIAGYYPSRTNCWSPALSKANQIDAPIFRMLGQDPVHYYSREYRLPDGRTTSEPDTMEPVWAAGRSPHFIKSFLGMIDTAPCMDFSYAQLGQENSFPWRDMEEAYPKQMSALANLRDQGRVHLETMGDSGRRFKKSFRQTPPQAQVMLDDSLGNTNPAERSIWYQSRFYRANLHEKGDEIYFRDLTIYSDQLAQPFLTEATRSNDVEQRMPAVLDGFHWSTKPGDSLTEGAGGFFLIDGKRVKASGRPVVHQDRNRLQADVPLTNGQSLSIIFDETGIEVRATGGTAVTLSFAWDPEKSALKFVESNGAIYEWQGLRYEVRLRGGRSSRTPQGWEAIQSGDLLRLDLAQE